jgi:small subunit ribosomal protein S12
MSTIHQCGSKKNKKNKKKRFNCLRSLGGCPQKKGVVSKVRIVSPKKPNSARRKVARVRLSNSLFVTAKIRGQGHNLQSYSTVLVCGGRANDLPGVRYSVIKGVLDFN